MIPGEIIPAEGEIELNAGQPTVTIEVANSGDRPVQVGSHYHFYETNSALTFDREKARGMPARHPRRHGGALRARPDTHGDARALSRRAAGLRLQPEGHGQAVSRTATYIRARLSMGGGSPS